jgi:UDP-N-acetylmuramyl pentapeptide phosphotransferase/UDP-N-acetylglucosamine-1-phosphate transferase
VFVSLLFAINFIETPLKGQMTIFFGAATPLLLFGCLEDLGRPVKPFWRLMAAAVSSALVVLFIGRWIPRLDIPGLDAAMGLFPVAALVTIFTCTATSHAFNIIDGLNGLCIGLGVVAFGIMATIAYASSDQTLCEYLVFLAVALVGVLPWNYPRARLFLGDSGAYMLGFLVSWMAIAIVWRNPQVTPWALVLVISGLSPRPPIRSGDAGGRVLRL